MSERAGKAEMAASYLNLEMDVELNPVVLVPEIEVLDSSFAPVIERTKSDEESRGGENDDANEDDADDGVLIPVAEDNVPVAKDNVTKLRRGGGAGGEIAKLNAGLPRKMIKKKK